MEAGVSPAHERYLQQAPAFAKELWRSRPPPPQGKAPNARVYPRVRLRLTIKTPNETQNFNRAVYGISPSYGEELTAYCCGSAERRPTNKFPRAHYGRARLRRAASAGTAASLVLGYYAPNSKGTKHFVLPHKVNLPCPSSRTQPRARAPRPLPNWLLQIVLIYQFVTARG